MSDTPTITCGCGDRPMLDARPHWHLSGCRPWLLVTFTACIAVCQGPNHTTERTHDE